jgi:addiction module RelE/StbE family toxin
MARVDWSRRALRDLDLIQSYIAQFDPVAAARIVNELVDAGNGLNDFPNRGRLGTHGRRELPSVPPYIIRYRVGRDIVTIQSVRHSARRPD